MLVDNREIKGLNDEQIAEARNKFGFNRLESRNESVLLNAIKSLAKEPMVILLLITSIIYFISGKTGDGLFLSSAIVLVASISLYQDSRSRAAIEKLKKYTQPHCKVIRNGIVDKILSENLVVGDSLLLEEGTAVNADGVIIHANDFSVDESILTGESFAVFKDHNDENNLVYLGTSVISGLAIANITAIGSKTKLGQIGKSLEDIKEEKTPLELQISNFVKKMVIAGAIVFAIVWVINFYKTNDALDSLLKALTLAMSILPEEIPVAFTTFMAIGAWRLMKIGVVVKQMKTVETLGSATVICTDKTGTITENRMSLIKVFAFHPESDTGLQNDFNNHLLYNRKNQSELNKIVDFPFGEIIHNDSLNDAKELIALAMWASEPIPFDPMEVALHNAYKSIAVNDERSLYRLVHEYPLSGKPPMMTHIFEDSLGKRIIAAKGAPEALMAVSDLNEIDKTSIEENLQILAKEGYRVLCVGDAKLSGNDYPAAQQAFQFQFRGIVAFYDPPKPNIKAVFKEFYDAGIGVKIITGDNAPTTSAIAKQIGFRGNEKILSGNDLMQFSDEELQMKVSNTAIFTRMFPDAKLRIVNALKQNNEIVAMTGDGVNDGPALKAAHIGIAMGKRGSEMAKDAASLILLEDDLSKMVDAVAMGRRIYSNLKKAIQYIISIHIPIILTVFIPLVLGWVYPNILLPIHVIFLELIMGPTCSIIYENEPMERNTMNQGPRPFTTTFFNWKELTTSIIQGLVIAIGTLLVYQYSVFNGYNETITRTMVFTVLINANIFLTLVNRSFYYSVIHTLKYKNRLVLYIISLTIAIECILMFFNPFTLFFELEQLNFYQLLLSIGTGFICVIWFEILKLTKRIKHDTEKLNITHG